MTIRTRLEKATAAAARLDPLALEVGRRWPHGFGPEFSERLASLLKRIAAMLGQPDARDPGRLPCDAALVRRLEVEDAGFREDLERMVEIARTVIQAEEVASSRDT